MMLEAQCRELAAMVKMVTAENAELRARLQLTELMPAATDGAGHVEWMRVISRVWQLRVTAVGERNLALAEVDRLTAAVARLEQEARHREDVYQTQISELLAK